MPNLDQIKINANAELKSSTKDPIFTLIGIGIIFGIIILCFGIVTFAIINPNLFAEIVKIVFRSK